MKTNMKYMGVVAALAIVVWGAVPAEASDAPQWTFATTFDEGLIVGENFEGLNVGDSVFAGPLSDITPFDPNGSAESTDFLVNNDNPDLNGNHLDGDSASDGGWSGFSFDESPGDLGAPLSGAYYIEGTVAAGAGVDNISNNLSIGVLNSSGNTQYNMTWTDPADSRGEPEDNGWGWSFGPNEAAWSGPGVFDPANPVRAITKVNLEAGFVTTYSFLAVDLKTGASFGHGG